MIHYLPGVGGNLQDHFQARAVYRCTRPITLRSVDPLLGAALGELHREIAMFGPGE